MGNISDEKVKELQLKATEIRKSIIESLTEAGSGHTAGSLGMTDIFTYLYFYALKHDPKIPDWLDRDIFVLSNGHICPGLYATMAHAGYFPVSELQTLRKLGSRLQGHPHREYLPGIETSSGPLGSGLSQAVGMALGIRIDYGKTTNRFVYCMVGDGELDEGQNWEAIMTASKYRLQNLILIVDRNNIQIDGYTEDVMPLNDLNEKFESFNWHVQEIDAHNFEMIDDAVGHAKSVFDKPSVIIANSIPGKGVEDFQRKPEWHGKSPTKDEAKNALKELRTLAGKIKCDQLD
ncbi:MAG TPA: transketolase [Candidatus Paceibacterota bacterium]|nr:transketolase [Candidatus Paceibacterota bacterium]HMP19078.1 transketolase [Candidatus Paceibacterota bacterium]